MDRERVYTLPFIWSGAVWIITSLYFVFSVALVALLVYVACTASVVTGVVGLVITLPILAAILIYCEGYAPQRLEVSEPEITVLCRFESVTILRSTILSIEPLSKKDMSWTINMGGCGGLFGYFGSFSNRHIGKFTMYATQKQNLYLIKQVGGKSVVISCSEPQYLIPEIKK